VYKGYVVNVLSAKKLDGENFFFSVRSIKTLHCQMFKAAKPEETDIFVYYTVRPPAVQREKGTAAQPPALIKRPERCRGELSESTAHGRPPPIYLGDIAAFIYFPVTLRFRSSASASLKPPNAKWVIKN
jgi:hypothetical protein